MATQSLEPATSLSVQILSGFVEAGSLREEWEQFILSGRGGVYMSLDWCRVWWDHYGVGREACVFVFRQRDRLVGIVPMFLERRSLGPLSPRIAKLVGCDSALTLCTLPVEPAYREEVVRLLLQEWLGRRRCDAVWFGPLSGEDRAGACVRSVCSAGGSGVKVVHDTSPGPHTSFDLPETFDAYVASLPKRQRQNYRRDCNLLDRSFKVESDVISDPSQILREFESFRQTHERQWQGEGKLGHFGDWPGSVAFNEDLIRLLGARGRARLFRLSADGRVVSYQYGFTFGNTLFWRLPGRSAEEKWNRFGLGRVGLLKMLELAIPEGVRRVEAGIGHYDYKLQLGAKEYAVESILVAADRPLCRFRATMLSAWARLLHLAYYRIWFLRLRPRLGLQQGALWKSWIRSRL